MRDREAVARVLAGYLDDVSWQDRSARSKAGLREMADAAIACLRERWTDDAALRRATVMYVKQHKHGIPGLGLRDALIAAMGGNHE